MTVAATDLAEFSGKQVVLHLIQEDGTVAELEGKVESASEAGMAFKEKGKRDLQLVLPDQVEEITVAATKPKTVPQKKLKPIGESNARTHLLDRHGYLRSWANAVTDEEAFAEHESIDHSDLGHRHMTEEEVAAKEAKSESSDDDDD